MFNLQCLTPSHGVVYMAAKKHYFGVGGGTRRFLSVVEKDGELVVINFRKITEELYHSRSFRFFFLSYPIPWVDGIVRDAIRTSCRICLFYEYVFQRP